MQVWSIFENQTELGVEASTLKLPKFDLVAFKIGSEGRGRIECIIPVDFDDPYFLSSLRSGQPLLLKHAKVGKTRSEKPKLVQCEPSTEDSFIAILRTPFGYRGYNKHTGDIDAEGNVLPFPGEIIARGRIADGDAGRMAQGEHLLAVIPLRTVFRAEIGGRRYGRPDEYFYYHTGETLLAFTNDERKAADLF